MILQDFKSSCLPPDENRDPPNLIIEIVKQYKTTKAQYFHIGLLVLGAGIEPALALGRTGF